MKNPLVPVLVGLLTGAIETLKAARELVCHLSTKPPAPCREIRQLVITAGPEEPIPHKEK